MYFNSWMHLQMSLHTLAHAQQGLLAVPYLLTGPNWNGQVPTGMTEIKTPTNLAWISNRLLVKGPSDLPNVHAIQDQISIVPLSGLQGNTTSPVSSQFQPLSSDTSTPFPT